MKKWFGAGVALLLASTPAVLIIGGVLVVAMVAGLMTAFSAGLGAVAGHEVSKSENGQCLADNGGGSGTPTTASQKEYVRTTIGIAKTMGVSEKGQIIALMVMFQESGIQNYANTGENHFGYPIGQGSSQSTQWWLDTAKLSLEYPHDATGKDADSVGLYQQRASAGWGDGGGYSAASSGDHGRKAIERLLDPRWSAQAFFGGDGGSPNRGLTDINGWEGMSLTQAAQTVQGSAFPMAYAKWEDKARALVTANSDAEEIPLLDGSTGGGSDTGGSGDDSGSGDEAGSATQKPMKEGTYTLTSDYGPRPQPTPQSPPFHTGTDFGAPLGTPIYAAAEGTVAAAGPISNGFGQWVVIDHQIDGQKYSTVYGHIFPTSIKVAKGDKVTAGQEIAGVGTEGNSTGPHLHFEVWKNGAIPYGSGEHMDPMAWVQGDHTSNGTGTSCDEAGGNSNAGSAAQGTAKQVIDAAKSQLGLPYSWGGGALNGPSGGFGAGLGVIGFDCSSLVRYAIYNGTGKTYELPRVSHDQWNATKSNTVPYADIQPGDLLFYARGGRVYHVAMALGDGMMIEAPKPGQFVQIVPTREANVIGVTRPDYKSTEADEAQAGSK